jgi:glutamine synthetase
MTATGQIDLSTLATLVDADEIDTVVVAFVDLQGRLMGKRVTGRFFLDHVAGTDDAEGEGIEACNYLLTVDVDMNVIEGFRYSTWEGGYGDFRGRPDLSTLCVTPWLEKTAMVLCDVVDHHGEPVRVSPRQVLQHQLDRAAERGLTVKFGSELEFFAYDRHFDDLAREQYRTLADHTSSWYNLDYHVFQTTKDEPLIRAIRNGMVGAGLPVEFSKGEAAPGQHELNLRYSDALSMADNHTIYKNGAKEIAHLQGKALTFMAKPTIDEPGSSCHIHSSIWSLADDRPLCASDEDRSQMSPIFRHWMGGILAHSRELSLCFAPFVNSYKRYQPDSWAPTAVVWSPDNRTCGLRLVGQGPAMRVESRIPGADCNPYIAFAAIIAAGLDGIDRELDCGDPYVGNGYTATDVERIPWNIVEAIALFEGSDFARDSLGEDVHFHLLHAAREEWKAFNNVVTEWELRRNFERI